MSANHGNRIYYNFWALFVLIGAYGSSGAADASVPTYARNTARPLVSVIDIDGPIDKGMSLFIERALRSVPADHRVVFRINTFGGRVDAAVRIRDAILNLPVETNAYVDRRAISAGALIALAATKIYLKEGATIGAATPVKQAANDRAGSGLMRGASEKVVSYMRAEMRATAEARGRDPLIAQAMVDRTIDVKGISKKGKLLTLTASDAKRHKFVDGVVADEADLLNAIGIPNARIVPISINWAEGVVRWITHPVVSSLLTTIGTVGLLTTFYSGTVGVLTAVGVGAFALFFFGHFIASLAGFEELLLFFGGLIAILLEVFVIPGFGVAGILGILLLFAGIALSLIEFNIPTSVSWELGYAKTLLSRVAIQMFAVMLAVIASAVALFHYLPKSRIGGWLVLHDEASQQKGYVGQRIEDANLIHLEGVAISDLRPSGFATIDGRRIDVVSLGDFIRRDSRIKVIDVSGGRVVVAELNLS